MDFKKNIPIIEKKLGYSFKDKSLLKQAFTRTSYCNEKNYRGREAFSSNEVLEFFGDSVLSTAIISILLDENTERYEHGIKTELNEGDLSNIRSKLSDKRNLSRSTAELGLQKFLLLGEGDKNLGISEEASVMEDLFESIIGAVYIDCGMNIKTVIELVKRILDISVYTSGEAPIQSYKNAIQEWCADKKRRLPPPVYVTLSEAGPDHKKTYERGCYIGGKLYGRGVGKNQKLADNAAAEAALKAIEEEEAAARAPKNAALTLKDIAARAKLPSPEFHDLGEAPSSRENERAFIVECCYGGYVASGIGTSKQQAREAAAAKILSEISSEKKKEEKKNVDKEKRAIKKLKPSKAEAGAAELGESKSKAPQKKRIPPKSAPKSSKSPSPKKAPHWQTKRS